jgi:hypothetical protein
MAATPATTNETVDPKNIIKARDLLYRLMIRYVPYSVLIPYV